MGLFRVTGRLSGPAGIAESVELLVDTGATLVVVPRILADRLGLAPVRTQPVVLAGGRREAWPVAVVRLALDGPRSRRRALSPRTALRCLVLWHSKACFLRLILWRRSWFPPKDLSEKFPDGRAAQPTRGTLRCLNESLSPLVS